MSQYGHKAGVREKASVQARAVTALHAQQDKCAARFVRFACASECTRSVHTRMQVLYPHASASKCACAVHAHKCKQVHKCICLCICMYTCICMCRHRHASACFGTAITAHRRDAVFTFAPWPHENKPTVSSHAPVKKLPSSQALGGDGQWQGMVAMRSRSHVHTQVG